MARNAVPGFPDIQSLGLEQQDASRSYSHKPRRYDGPRCRELLPYPPLALRVSWRRSNSLGPFPLVRRGALGLPGHGARTLCGLGPHGFRWCCDAFSLLCSVFQNWKAHRMKKSSEQREALGWSLEGASSQADPGSRIQCHSRLIQCSSSPTTSKPRQTNKNSPCSIRSVKLD